jgi:PAS domain S-box-containing protein
MSQNPQATPRDAVADAPERRDACAAPRTDAGRFRKIADSLPVIVWTIDPGGSCTYVNRGWYEYTGQSPGEGEGNGWHACVHPDDLAATAGQMEAAMARREPFRIEYRLRRSDGAWRWMLDAGAPCGSTGAASSATSARSSTSTTAAAPRRAPSTSPTTTP